MKKLIFTLVLASLSSLSMASCYWVDLEYNTDIHFDCPELTSLCANGDKGDVAVMPEVDQVFILKYQGTHRMSNSDVSEDYYNTYLGDYSATISLNTDGNYPATLTGGLKSLEIYKDHNSCYYKLVPKK